MSHIFNYFNPYHVVFIALLAVFFLKEMHYSRFKYRKMSFFRRIYFNEYNRVNSANDNNRQFKEIQNKYAHWLLLIVIYLVGHFLVQHFLLN